MQIGYDSAFIGTTLALPSFTEEFKFDEMTDEHLALIKANIVSLYQAGAFFGALFAYGSAYFLGRKKSLWVFATIFIVGAGMMLGATGDRGLGLIYAGRVLAGIGVGGASNVVPIYISEIAPPAVRGRLVGIYELGWQIGGLVGFWVSILSIPEKLHVLELTEYRSTMDSMRLWLLVISNGLSRSPYSSSLQVSF